MMTDSTAGSEERPSAFPGVVFYDVAWDDYEAMLRIVGERPIRVTYDQGTMEVFNTSLGHNSDAHLLGRLVNTLTEELEVDVAGGGTTTHKRRKLDKGAEPDQCYWLGANARCVRGKRHLDFDHDPVPDLIIVVDVTRTSLDRLEIFTALGVPEVWRATDRSLQFFRLQEDGTYQPRPTSRYFPTLPAASVAQFLKDRRTTDKPAWIRSFRAFVREKDAPGRRPNGR